MNKALQTSESLRLGITLALSGGFMDAYSYIERGHVFANAQTGNMLLLGVHLSEGNVSLAIQYFFPVLAFAIGIALADVIRFRNRSRLHWRQSAVLIEAVVLAVVSFFSQEMNLLANSLTSFACGIQVESFRKIHGQGIATTMCIGNLRSATQHLCSYFHTKEKHYLDQGILYFEIIFCFMIGAIIGNIFIRHFHERAVLVCCFFQITAFFMMFEKRQKTTA